MNGTTQNWANRYEPGLLIEDTSAKTQGDRATAGESAVELITEATSGFFPTDDEMIQEMYNDAYGTLSLRTITKYAGLTVISAVTYMRADGTVMIRKNRSTWLRGDDGQYQDECSIESDTELLSLINHVNPDQWDRVLIDLLNRKSDLAARHVQRRLQYFQFASEADGDAEDTDILWRGQRYPRYDLFENAAAVPVTNIVALAPSDPTCFTCSNDYAHLVYIPLTLSCCGKHICRPCFIAWCKSQGPTGAACPHCRTKFFSDEATIQALTTGVQGKSYPAAALGNERYNQWETFERMSADLDQRIADNNQDPILVNALVLAKVFDYLVQGARLEPESSTPILHQPARRPEFELLVNAFPSMVQAYNGQTLPTATLYTELYAGIMEFFANEAIRGRFNRNATADEMSSFVPNADSLDLPEGLDETIRRMLRRMLHFCHVRMCGDDEGCVKWHKHGERTYCHLGSVMAEERKPKRKRE